MRSINDFKSSFSGDLARTNRFDVEIPVPLTLIPYLKTSKTLNYRCEVANLPGRTFATTEQKTYGPIEKFPYLSTYNDIDLTFIVDDDMSQKFLFDGWLNYINPNYNYNLRYKENYATTLTINQYDVSNEKTYTVSLFDAFPISMNQLDLDWNGEGYHKLSVTFAYTYWKNLSLQGLGMDLLDAGLDSIATSIGGLGGSIGGAVASGFSSMADSVNSPINFNE
jgi:hypothetical protein